MGGGGMCPRQYILWLWPCLVHTTAMIKSIPLRSVSALCCPCSFSQVIWTACFWETSFSPCWAWCCVCPKAPRLTSYTAWTGQSHRPLIVCHHHHPPPFLWKWRTHDRCLKWRLHECYSSSFLFTKDHGVSESFTSPGHQRQGMEENCESLSG